MYYIIEDDKLKSCDLATMLSHENGIGYCPPSEVKQLINAWQIPHELEAKLINDRHTLHRNYENFDLFIYSLMVDNVSHQLAVIMRQNSLAFFGDEAIGQVIDRYLQQIVTKVKAASLNRVLYWVMEQQLQNDAVHIDRLENAVESLQTIIMSQKKFTNIQQIIDLRTAVVSWKQYFEEQTIIFDNLEENENDLIEPEMLSLFHILNNRAQRLLANSIDLKEAINHVHDTYQMLIDISLNNTMKIFTVVSTIFLPLTLVTSWYGMNLKMPEFTWTYGYYYVMGLCLFVISLCIWLFKRRGWF